MIVSMAMSLKLVEADFDSQPITPVQGIVRCTPIPTEIPYGKSLWESPNFRGPRGYLWLIGEC